jgi:hypothetical protein
MLIDDRFAQGKVMQLLPRWWAPGLVAGSAGG